MKKKPLTPGPVLTFLLGQLYGKAPSAPEPLTIKEVNQLSGLLMDNLEHVPDVPLSRQERGKLDGCRIRGSVWFTEDVMSVLRERGELFPEITTRPDEIRAGLARATAWSSLADAAQQVADRAAKNAAIEDGTAAGKALQIIAHMRALASSPFPLHDPETEQDRKEVLRDLEQRLSWAHRKKMKKKYS